MTSTKLDNLNKTLQGTTNQLKDWVSKNDLRFSLCIKKAIIFSNKRKTPSNCNITTENSRIQTVQDLKILGLTTDHKFSWKNYITDLKVNCLKSFDVLKMNLHANLSHYQK